MGATRASAVPIWLERMARPECRPVLHEAFAKVAHPVHCGGGMDLNKFTQMSRQAVTDAQAIARRLNNNEVETWHLLSALLAQENGVVPGLIDKMGLSASALQLAVERELERLPKVTGSVDTSKVFVTQAVNDVLTKAEQDSKSLRDEFVLSLIHI